MANQPTNLRQAGAEYIQAFTTGWFDEKPDVMVLSLTTHTGVHDFAMNKEQAMLIAKTINQTAAQLAKPK